MRGKRLLNTRLVAAVAAAACSALAPLPLRAQAASEPLHGRRHDFLVSGMKAFLVTPESAPRKAWLWYAPTIGRHPNANNHWLFNRLLDAGVSVAGIDIGESFGNAAGRAAFDRLFAHLTEDRKLGRPCLLGQSRGALMLYNWAADHPGKVRCIAGIYPVLDLESWPGLSNKGLHAAYGTDDPGRIRELFPEINPIDRMAPLAAARVPVLHIHGTADRVVPADRNSIPFARRYATMGGEQQLVLVPDKGHEEVREFFQSAELLRFLLKHLGHERNE